MWEDKPIYPYYNDDNDYNTNAPSFYDYLAKNRHLLKELTEKVFNYDKELAKRFEEWDKNLETLPDDLKRMLEDWMADGTLAHLINEVIFEELNTKITSITPVESVESLLTDPKINTYNGLVTAKRFFNDSEYMIGAKYKIIPHDENETWTPLYNGLEYNQNGEINIGNGLKLYYVSEGTVNVKHFGAVTMQEKYNDTRGIKASLLFLQYKDNTEQTYSSTGYKLYFPSGFYRVTEPLIIKTQRISIVGDGFSSILSADNGVPFLFDLQVPRPNSSSLNMQSIMLMNANVLVNSTIVHVDCSIHHCWFGQAKTHLKGAFVTLNLTNNIFELATEGSIIATSSNGMRKIVLADNNFYANSNYHVQILNGNPSIVDNVLAISITGNVFDQITDRVLDNSFSGGVRIDNARYVIVNGNVFNGKGNPYKSSCLRITNSQYIESDNLYNACESDVIYIDNSKHVKLTGIIGESKNGVSINKSEYIEIDMDISNGTTGMRITDSQIVKLNGSISEMVESGVTLLKCKKITTSDFFNVRNCNTIASIEKAGFVIGDTQNISEEIIMNGSWLEGNKNANILITANTKNVILKDIVLGSDELTTIVDNGGINVIKEGITSFIQ